MKNSKVKNQNSKVRTCRICGCTDDNCIICIQRTGKQCYWVEEDLCSACTDSISLSAYLLNQQRWSVETFGSAKRTIGIIKHIKKELQEIEEKPFDLEEWIDVIILALDGYWRHGGDVDEIMLHLIKKQKTNFDREYPFPQSDNEPSEHIRN